MICARCTKISKVHSFALLTKSKQLHKRPSSNKRPPQSPIQGITVFEFLGILLEIWAKPFYRLDVDWARNAREEKERTGERLFMYK